MRPLQVLRLCVSERWQLACQVKIAVVPALLTGQVATMSNVIFKCGYAEASIIDLLDTVLESTIIYAETDEKSSKHQVR